MLNGYAFWGICGHYSCVRCAITEIKITQHDKKSSHCWTCKREWGKSTFILREKDPQRHDIRVFTDTQEITDNFDVYFFDTNELIGKETEGRVAISTTPTRDRVRDGNTISLNSNETRIVFFLPKTDTIQTSKRHHFIPTKDRFGIVRNPPKGDSLFTLPSCPDKQNMQHKQIFTHIRKADKQKLYELAAATGPTEQKCTKLMPGRITGMEGHGLLNEHDNIHINELVSKGLVLIDSGVSKQGEALSL